MTGRRLYEKYTDALRSTAKYRWVGDQYVRKYPVHAPFAWAFLPDDDRAVWNDLALRVTPPKRRVAT